MARPYNDRNLQFFLILANLPESVLRHPPGESWKPVKDLIYSHINSEDREYGRIDIADGIAVCRMHDEEQRREAYGYHDCLSLGQMRVADTAADALQGLSWRNSTLKAWLCEKRGQVMEQSEGPIDRRTGNVIPAPGHLMRMTPSLARRIGCMPFPQPLPSPPPNPQYGTTFIRPVATSAEISPSYPYPTRAKSASAYGLQMAKHSLEVTPPLSQTSRSSSISATSTELLLDPAHPRIRCDTSLPNTRLVSQAATSCGGANASTSSSTPATQRRLHSALSNRSTSPSHAICYTGYNKIKLQNFHPKASANEIEHFLEHTCQLNALRKKTCNINGRSPRAFVTFRTDQDAEIAVQQLNGVMVGGRKLKVSLDLQRIWHPLTETENSSTWHVHNTFPVRKTMVGKSSSAAKTDNEATPKPAQKGPVIIDGS